MDWKQIEEFPNYEVSESGVVRNVNTKVELKHKIDKGYHRVTLYDNGKPTRKPVHQLVAETFHGKHPNKSEINHVDGDKSNNHICNLEYCSRSENLKHAFRTGLKQPSGGLKGRAIRVVETGKIYESIHECGRDLGCDPGHISHCLAGGRKSHKGYHFEYV